jgi:adenosylmethionine-8-amino-7-oxononanoate aminotransferase
MSSSWNVRDAVSIWHPFTQAQTESPPLPIVRGEGVYLYGEDGRGYLDAISSWWVNLHGHGHPYIAQAIFQQAERLEHVLFAGFTHPQAILFAERLLALLPKGYSRIFYSDNGSTAVEVALKMAFQSKKGGKKLLCFEAGYHGDTFGAMSAAGKSHYNRPFWPYLFEVCAIPPPSAGREESSWAAFIQAMEREEGKIAAFLFEPLVQGAGGMRLHSPEILGKMVAFCQERDILTISDEVMTGFGRTGPLFASSKLSLSPDLICLSKGITGGFLPLGVTATKEALFDAFLSSDPADAFLHGHSYTANPICCAAANANLDLLLDAECSASRIAIEGAHRQFQDVWGDHPKLLRCDLLGTLLVLEYRVEDGSYYHPLKQQLIALFRDRQILVRPLGNVLYLLPPYCITLEELRKIYAAIAFTLEEWP